MADRVRAFNWATTPLGGIEAWPERLAAAVEAMLAAPQLATLAIGPERIFLYNDEASRHYGARHPHVFTLPLAQAFPHEFRTVETFYDRVFAGESLHVPAQLLDPRQTGTPDVFDAYLTPIWDADGEVIGAHMVGFAVSDRQKAEWGLRESEERLRQFGEASQNVLWLRDARTLQWSYLTPAFETIYGLRREEVLAGDNYRSWLELIVPEDRPIAEDAVWRVRRGERVTFDCRIRRPVDGAIRWLRDTTFPLVDGSGEITVFGGVGHDLTELRETEFRLQALVDGIPQLVWRAVSRGEWTWASPQWIEYTGQAEADSHGWGWLEPLHPDDHEIVRQAWSTALEKAGFEVEYRIRHAETQIYRWFQTRATAVRDNSGAIVEWLGTSTDIDELRKLQARQQILVTELQHRTFNLMGMVRSMADATVRSSSNLEEFTPKFVDRVDALARVQRLLSRLEEGDRVFLDELIRSELSAVGAFSDGDERVILQGPSRVALHSSTVQTLAMVIHELTTNAVKYGALKQPGARLHVGWRLDRSNRDGKPWLHIDWYEAGVTMPPADAVPRGTGQGRTLIEEALPYQLQARTTYIMSPDGVKCSISLPIPAQR